MFYCYELNKSVLVITDSLAKVEADSCEEFETITDIPIHDYGYFVVNDALLDVNSLKYLERPWMSM